MRKSALASLLVGGVVSALCLWYAFRGVRPAELWEGAIAVGPMWLLLSVLAALANLLVRAARWQLLLPSLPSIRFAPLASATFIGIMANNLLPARMGEVIRAWTIARQESAPMPTILGSVVIERMLDGLTTLLILGVCAALWTHPKAELSRVLQQTGLIITFVAAVALMGLVAIVRYRERVLDLFSRLARLSGPRWGPRAIELLDRFLHGLCVFSNGTQTAAVCGLSVAAWSLLILSFHLLAVGFALPVTPIQTALVFVIIMLGIAIPSAPGFVGTFHGFCVVGLSLVADVDAPKAAAYATVLHGSQWLTINVIGLVCLMRSGTISWSGMTQLAKRG